MIDSKRREIALRRLREIGAEEADGGDREGLHVDADRVLIELIDDPEITQAYDAIPKWFA